MLFDSDEKIIKTWQYLIRASQDEILALPVLDHGDSVDDFDIQDGAKYLIGWWLNKGAASPCKTPSSWMRSGVRPKSFWCDEIRTRIARQVDHIRHWTAVQCDYSDAPNIVATWFVDPPYSVAGRLYKHGAKDIDYDALADWCMTRNGQLLVCEKDGADWLPFEPWQTVKASPAKHGGKKSVEVIFTGGERCS
jgi:hypothetical protein